MFSLSLLFSNTILSFGQECKLGKGMFGLGRFLLNITQEPLLAVDKKNPLFLLESPDIAEAKHQQFAHIELNQIKSCILCPIFITTYTLLHLLD